MGKLILPEHENDLLLDYPNYWDSYETTIDIQIDLVNRVNHGEYQILEKVTPYYSEVSKLLFDKLYCADFHHVHKAVIIGETGTMNQQVINEFFKLNFEGERFSYEDLLENIRTDIVNAIKEYTYNLPLEELKAYAHGILDSFVSSFDDRYWLQVNNLSELNYTDESFVTFRRAKQLEKVLTENCDQVSYFISSTELKHRQCIEVLYGHAGDQMAMTYFINITNEEFFNKKI